MMLVSTVLETGVTMSSLTDRGRGWFSFTAAKESNVAALPVKIRGVGETGCGLVAWGTGGVSGGMEAVGHDLRGGSDWSWP